MFKYLEIRNTGDVKVAMLAKVLQRAEIEPGLNLRLAGSL